jgi:hypothetical protein
MKSERRFGTRDAARTLAAIALSAAMTGLAWAEVPPAIEAGLRKMGPIVDPACTARLYRPSMPAKDITSGDSNIYPGIRVVRDQSFGTHPKDVVDIFTAEQGAAWRDVLIYVPGGGGDKIEIQNKESNAFYDNIGRWAARHGMVGVTMQRHASGSWDGGAKDISAMIQWLQANVSKYKGNSARMFIWAHSAGNVPVGTYIGRAELYGSRGVGLKGAIFMSAAPFNILPARTPPVDIPAMMAMFASAGKVCGESGGLQATAGALPGKSPGQPGGPPLPPPGGAEPAGPGTGARGAPPPMSGAPGAGGPAVDAATQLARSSLPGLTKSGVRIMLANAELDPGVDMTVDGGLTGFNKALNDALCAVGRQQCPTLLVARGHSHMSIVFSIDTTDTSVSDSVLTFIQSTR